MNNYTNLSHSEVFSYLPPDARQAVFDKLSSRSSNKDVLPTAVDLCINELKNMNAVYTIDRDNSEIYIRINDCKKNYFTINNMLFSFVEDSVTLRINSEKKEILVSIDIRRPDYNQITEFVKSDLTYVIIAISPILSFYLKECVIKAHCSEANPFVTINFQLTTIHDLYFLKT